MAQRLVYCDGCGKRRRDVQSCGRDANGERDGPDLCFVCRKEDERGRLWDRLQNRYVRWWERARREDTL